METKLATCLVTFAMFCLDAHAQKTVTYNTNHFGITSSNLLWSNLLAGASVVRDKDALGRITISVTNDPVFTTVKVTALTASRATIIDGNNALTNHPTVTATELGYVDRATNNIQDELHKRWDDFCKLRVNYWLNAGSGGLQVLGDTATTTGSATHSNPTSDTQQSYSQYAASASTGSDAGLHGNTLYRAGKKIVMSARLRFVESASIRCWIGFSDQTLTTMTGSDNPAGNYAAFRYSTPASDTGWKCITKDNTTQTISDSGVAFNTSANQFEVHEVGSSYVFFINGTSVFTNTTTLPTAGTNLRVVMGVETQENVAKNVRIEWVIQKSGNY